MYYVTWCKECWAEWIGPVNVLVARCKFCGSEHIEQEIVYVDDFRSPREMEWGAGPGEYDEYSDDD